MTHLLVTNDFPPKIGGIQSYLHELWRRLPPEEVVVLTTAHPDAAAWDADQPFRVIRQPDTFLIPSPALIGRIDEIADEVDADLVILDPVWPLGFCGPQLSRPYGVVLHGSELTVPGHLPFVQLLARRTLRGARLVVAAGGYPAAEGHRVAGRELPTVVVPPGVDTNRFVPLDAEARASARESFGIDPSATVLLGVSRLVPRKGFDVLLQAVHRLLEDFPDLHLVIGGDGRDRGRLEQVAGALSVPTTFLGAVDDDALPRLYGCADIFAMVCRDRWLGLEQEGFGIVFLEAAAAGLSAIVGRSGGSAEAVVDGETGFVIDQPRSVEDVVDALQELLDDPDRRGRLGAAARARAERSFAYDLLAAGLRDVDRSHDLGDPPASGELASHRRTCGGTDPGSRRGRRLVSDAEAAGATERRRRPRGGDEPPGSRDRRADPPDVEPARLRPKVARPPDTHDGQAIITASWVGTGLFALVAVPAAVAPDVFAPFLIVVSLGLFLAGTAVFALAYLTAIGRSREVLIGMGGLFFLAGGTAPLRVSRHLIGSFASQCGLAVTTTVVGLFTVPAEVTNPVAFGVLVPIYGLGLVGLWSARHGTFSARPPDVSARSRRRAS